MIKIFVAGVRRRGYVKTEAQPGKGSKYLVFTSVGDNISKQPGQWKSQAAVNFSGPQSINLNALRTCIFRYWERLN